jgi:hypothetical protein
MTGLLGTGPRAMPLRAAPGEKLGAAACAARTKHNAQPVLQTPIACPTGTCQLGNARTPHEPSQPTAPGPPEAPFKQL